MLAESESESFIEIPYYVGLLQYLKMKFEIAKVINTAIKTQQSYICRVPGNIGNILSKQLRKKGIPYAVEIVGDPWTVFAPHTFNHVLRPFIRISSYLRLKKTVKKSSVALYVTKYNLQKRYPVSNNITAINASNVILPDKSKVSRPKIFNKKKNEIINIISIGSLAQMYKAPDIAIEGIKVLSERGWNCHLTWLGDGIYKDKMIKYAAKMNVAENVHFIGSIPSGDGIWEALSKSDLFILVSRTEGLPRSMIEAMAMGLPCIGTFVGGIPELLDKKALIVPNNSLILANKIEELFSSSELINHLAEENYIAAGNYKESVLIEKRQTFYNEIINLSEK